MSKSTLFHPPQQMWYKFPLNSLGSTKTDSNLKFPGKHTPGQPYNGFVLQSSHLVSSVLFVALFLPGTTPLFEGFSHQ